MTNLSDLSNRDWGASNEPSNARSATEAYEFNQRGKPMKALIGLAILVAIAVALAFFKPAADHFATAPGVQQNKGSAITQVNREPGRTIGQAPTSTNSSTR